MKTVNQMSVLLVLWCGFILFVSCSTNTKPEEKLKLEGNFAFEGLVTATYEVKRVGNTLYAGTDKGLYKNVGSNNWKYVGPAKVAAFGFVILSEKEFLVPILINNRDSTTIAKTTDGGQSWIPFQNGYGGSYDQLPFVMVQDPANSQIIYAGGPGLRDFAISTNQGKTWNLIKVFNKGGQWGSLGGLFFIYIDPNNVENIWIGGESAIFQAVLFHSENGGKDWEQFQFLENTDARATDIALGFSNKEHILVGLGETADIIRKSTNGGKSWYTVLKRIYIKTLIHSASRSVIVYASGINREKKLFFVASGDFGETWERIVWEEGPQQIEVNDMISIMQNGREVLYFGTNKGVYSYTFKK